MNAGTSTPRTRRLLPWLLVLGGLVVVALVAGAPREESGTPLDPGSTAPSGTKALVELLRSFGAQVDTDATALTDRTDVALLLVDNYDPVATDALEAWVRAGGTLVVADPFSTLAPDVDGATGSFGVGPPLDAQRCDVDALLDVGTIEPGGAVRFEVGESDRSCFGDGTAAYVVEQARGAGRIVAVGGPDLFTNEQLGAADDAVLATRLLVPTDGTRTAILQPAAGFGDDGADRSLGDVLGQGVRLAILQLVVAFVVYAWYRARRLGPPVLEPQPVEIDGSELVVAVGQLLQQAKRPQHAADLLRADTRRRLGERLGLPVDASPSVLADVVAGRTDIDPDQLRRLLADAPVADDAALLELARNLDSLRQEVLHGR